MGMGCSDSKEVHGLPVGASIEGELNLSWMQMFPSPFMSVIFVLIAFFFQEASQGTLPWRGDQWWQFYQQAFHGNEKVGS
jgi:hypothetical protein